MTRKLIWFHMHGCPYCIKMKDQWHEAAQQLTAKGVITESYERHQHPEKTKEYGIASWPTIVLEDENGDRILYRGARTVDAMVQFAQRKTPDMFTQGQKYVVLFYADWCAHCKRFKPTWETLSRQGVTGVTFQAFETSEHPELSDQFAVRGIPTLVGIDSTGKRHLFTGNRSHESLQQFAENLA